jgi:hypothetical protein
MVVPCSPFLARPVAKSFDADVLFSDFLKRGLDVLEIAVVFAVDFWRVAFGLSSRRLRRV